MESVVIPWRQINHHIAELVAFCMHLINQRLHTLVVLVARKANVRFRRVRWISAVAQKEFVKAIRTTFNAINRAVRPVYFAYGEYATVTRGTDSLSAELV